MIYVFRTPPWYRFTLLILYTSAGLMVFREDFKLLSSLIKVTLVLAFAFGAAILIKAFTSTLKVDTVKGEVIVGKHRVGVGDLERVRVRFTGVVFCLKDGRRVVHPYPVEDGKILKELLGRGKRESWGEVEGSDAVRSAAPDKGDAEQGNRNHPQG